MDQIFALQQVFEKSWEYAKEVYICFVELEKTYDRVPRDKYDVRGQLFDAIKLLYKQSEICVCVNGMKTNVSVELREGCVLSPLLFITYMDKIDGDSFYSSAVTFRECNVRRLLLADDLALLSLTLIYLRGGPQRTLIKKQYNS